MAQRERRRVEGIERIVIIYPWCVRILLFVCVCVCVCYTCARVSVRRTVNIGVYDVYNMG